MHENHNGFLCRLYGVGFMEQASFGLVPGHLCSYLHHEFDDTFLWIYIAKSLWAACSYFSNPTSFILMVNTTGIFCSIKSCIFCLHILFLNQIKLLIITAFENCIYSWFVGLIVLRIKEMKGKKDGRILFLK